MKKRAYIVPYSTANSNPLPLLFTQRGHAMYTSGYEISRSDRFFHDLTALTGLVTDAPCALWAVLRFSVAPSLVHTLQIASAALVPDVGRRML